MQRTYRRLSVDESAECRDWQQRSDLEDKLLDFRDYYNNHRTHSSLEGQTPNRETKDSQPFAEFHSYQWQSHCRGLYQTPIAA